MEKLFNDFLEKHSDNSKVLDMSELLENFLDKVPLNEDDKLRFFRGALSRVEDDIDDRIINALILEIFFFGELLSGGISSDQDVDIIIDADLNFHNELILKTDTEDNLLKENIIRINDLLSSSLNWVGEYLHQLESERYLECEYQLTKSYDELLSDYTVDSYHLDDDVINLFPGIKELTGMDSFAKHLREDARKRGHLFSGSSLDNSLFYRDSSKKLFLTSTHLVDGSAYVFKAFSKIDIKTGFVEVLTPTLVTDALSAKELSDMIESSAKVFFTMNVF